MQKLPTRISDHPLNVAIRAATAMEASGIDPVPNLQQKFDPLEFELMRRSVADMQKRVASLEAAIYGRTSDGPTE